MINNPLKIARIVILTFLILASCNSQKDELVKAKNQEINLLAVSLANRNIEESKLIKKAGFVRKGEGFFQMIRGLDIQAADALKIIDELRDYVEFSKLKVGDEVKAVFAPDKALQEFTFSSNPAEKHVLIKKSITDTWEYEFQEAPTVWEERIVTGQLVSGSTLQENLIGTGLKRNVVADIVNVLLCKINFRLDAREGDQYKVLLRERLYQGNILETQILYTSYEGIRAGKSEAFYYDDQEKNSTYSAHYTEEGEALIRSGLRYPVKHLHIRSGYGLRRHPVTGLKTMHRGVDLRGRKGDPVYAAASGIVVESSYDEFSGNKVAIRHADSSVSYYLHLNTRGVNKGVRVKSHQQIGTIGETGRVTGPHLHFGFKKSNGSWMNPMSKRMIATPKLKGEKYVLLKEQIANTKKILERIDMQKVSQNQERILATDAIVQ